jgi:sugar-specific transcriptional regulator TrmB
MVDHRPAPSGHDPPQSNPGKDVLPVHLRLKMYRALDFSDAVRCEPTIEVVLELAIGRSREEYDDRLRHFDEEFDRLIIEREKDERTKRIRSLLFVVQTVIGVATAATPIIRLML